MLWREFEALRDLRICAGYVSKVQYHQRPSYMNQEGISGKSDKRPGTG